MRQSMMPKRPPEAISLRSPKQVDCQNCKHEENGEMAGNGNHSTRLSLQRTLPYGISRGLLSVL
jgi:hypothetical protein